MSPETGGVQGVYGIGYVSLGVGWSPDGESAVMPVVRMGGGSCCDAGLIAGGIEADYTYLPRDGDVGLRASAGLSTMGVLRSEEAIAEAKTGGGSVLSVGSVVGPLFVVTDRRGSHGGNLGFDSPDRTATGVMVGLGAGHAWGALSGIVVKARAAYEGRTFEY